ncbi:MAG: hypothetical protein PWR01_4365 [Clostridiales bacterium]|nr:hypothetical protein [Clostridiales bacterium]MDN5283292.1 hypothetical protein [Candidatus Ozemobacter sp.]
MKTIRFSHLLAGIILVLTLFSSLDAQPMSEKQMFEKGKELSYEGQVQKARSLIEEMESETEPKSQDDGSTGLILSMIWGAFGAGYFIFGKKQSRAVFLLCGIGLCVFPYFIPSAFVSFVVGLILCLLPFKIRF